LSDSALSPFKERIATCQEASRRLREFWRSFPTIAARLKGKPISAQGKQGELMDASGEELLLTRRVEGGADATVRVWNTVTGTELRSMKEQRAGIYVAISPCGRYATSASSDGSLRLWDTGAEREVRTFRGHFGPAVCVAYSPDGLFALSGGDDTTVKFWKLWNGDSAP
jgi:WD40 repeat protein